MNKCVFGGVGWNGRKEEDVIGVKEERAQEGRLTLLDEDE